MEKKRVFIKFAGAAILTAVLSFFCVTGFPAAGVSKKTAGNDKENGEEDMRMLANMLDGIYKGRDHTVRTAIAGVILQRVKSPIFPDSITEVVFSDPIFKEALHCDHAPEPTEESVTAVSDAAEGMSPCPEALFFYVIADEISIRMEVIYQSDGFLFA